jgi:cytochrome c-type biogenesis protein CcmH
MTQLFLILLAIGLLVCGMLFLPFLRRNSTMHRSILPPILASILVLFVSVGLYSFMGSPRLLPVLEMHETKMEDLAAEALRLESEIATSQNDAQLHFDLGDSYAAMGRNKEAIASFKKAILISKGNPQYIMALARAEMSLANGEVTEPAQKAFEMVLLQDKTNLQARYFLALGKKQRGEKAEALKDFEALLVDLPEGIPLRSAIKQHINELN